MWYMVSQSHYDCSIYNDLEGTEVILTPPPPTKFLIIYKPTMYKISSLSQHTPPTDYQHILLGGGDRGSTLPYAQIY